MSASIVLSALCSMLEATLLSTPLSFITGLEEQGIAGAARLKKLKQNTDRPISAILCLNTIANTVGASIVGSLVYEVYGDALVGAFSTIFTLAILIFSEIIPKTVGSSYWRSLALPASAIISMMIFITFPLVWVLEHLQRLISSNSNQVSVSREDISAMVSVATEEEVIEKDEKMMIQNLLKLDEVTAHEIMTPSVVVEMVPGSMTIKEFYDSDNTHSRILVYDEENDEYVIGYVLRQEILEKMAAGRIEVLGGARIVVEDGKLVSAEIGGKPIDDNKIYGLVTISFLLSGGDGLSLAENAVSVTEYKDVMIWITWK